MHRQTILMSSRADVFRAVTRQKRAAGEVVRILQCDQSGRSDIVRCIVVQRARDFIPRQDSAAIIAADRPS